MASPVVKTISTPNDEAYQTQIDDAGTFVYIGSALSGAATSAASFSIKRVTSATGVTLWAAGTKAYNQVWDDRVSLSYS